VYRKAGNIALTKDQTLNVVVRYNKAEFIYDIECRPDACDYSAPVLVTCGKRC